MKRKPAKPAPSEPPTVYTSDELRLIAAGWKNIPYGVTTRFKKEMDFPRGVWTHPRHPGPHSLAVALIADRPDDPNGKPFADPESVADLRRSERAERAAAKEREKAEVRAEAAERAERLKLERALQ